MTSTFIKGWYPLCPNHEIRNKPIALTRLGRQLVLWRNNDGIVVMEDKCPHRSARLSLGCIKNNTIRCPYHGFQFNKKGECDFAPELNSALPKLTVKTYHAHESHNMIWCYWGNEPKQFSLPENFLPQKKHCAYSQFSRIWQSHITYCIENQLDSTHLEFVHHGSIGKYSKPPTYYRLDTTEHGIDIFHHENKPPAVQLCLPAVWKLNISSNMQIILFFSPINDTHTQLYLRTYRHFLTLSIVRKLINPIMNYFNASVLKEDQAIVASQGTLPAYKQIGDHLMKYDKAIKWLREYWQNNLV